MNFKFSKISFGIYVLLFLNHLFFLITFPFYCDDVI